MTDPQSLLRMGVEMLVDGTLLAAVTWGLSRLLRRRVDPAIVASVWTVALLKFLFPPILPGWLNWGQSLSGLTRWIATVAMAPGGEPVTGTVPGVSSLAAAAAGGEDASWFWSIVLVVGAGVYALGVLLRLWRAGRGLRRLRAFLNSCPAAEAKVAEVVARKARQIGLRRPPRVLSTAERISPFVVGLGCPTLVLSKPVLDELPEPLQEALILHELAHLRRRDPLVRGVQEFAKVVLFFWPPVFWVCRQIERTTEMACDQWAVLHSRIRPADYAESLLAVVKQMNGGTAVSQRLAFARRGSFLEERFEMILAKNRRLTPEHPGWMFLLVGAWALFCLPGGLFAGRSGEPASPAQSTVRVIKLPMETDSPDAVRLRLEFCPEADLDGDGAVTVAELQDFVDAHPDQYGLTVDVNQVDGQRLLAVKLTSSSAGTGELTDLSEGAEGGRRVVIVREVAEGEGTDRAVTVDEKSESNLEGEEEAVFQFDLPPDGNAVWVSDGKVQIEQNDGKPLGKVFAYTISGDPSNEGKPLGKVYTYTVGDDPSGEDEPLEKDFEYTTGDDPSEVQTFTRQGEDGETTTVVIRRHKKVKTKLELTSEERRVRFLRDHPEADANGDGVLSPEESRAYVAGLKQKTKP